MKLTITTTGVCIGIVLGTLIFFSVAHFMRPLSFTNFFLQPLYKIYSINDLKNPLIMEISEYCSPFEDINQVECVVNIVSDYYNYSENRSGSIIQTPEEFFKFSSLCRDITLVYNSIFTNLDWRTDFVFTPNHVYLNMYKGYKKNYTRSYTYCEVDGINYKCY